MDDRHASDCGVHNGPGVCDCWVDLIERARKLGRARRFYPFAVGSRTNVTIDAEEVVAMKAVIRDLADALEARLPKGEENGDG